MNKKLGIALIICEVAIVPVGIIGTVHLVNNSNIEIVDGLRCRYVRSDNAYTIEGIDEDSNYKVSGSITLPSKIDSIPVTSVKKNAFEYNTDITSVIFPTSITSIGKNAFYGCSNLTNIRFVGGYLTVESGAFSSCSNLTKITDGCTELCIDDTDIFDYSYKITDFVVTYTTYVGRTKTSAKYSGNTLTTASSTSNWTKLYSYLSSYTNLYLIH